MEREGVVKMKRRPRYLTKKTRGPCNFCEFSSSREFSRELKAKALAFSRYGCSSEEKLQEQGNEAVLRKEVERLRLLIKRITGKDDGVTFTELLALESHLTDVRCIVLDQTKTKLEEDERQKEAEDEAGGTRRGVLVPCKFSASSSEESQEKRNGESLKIKREFERRSVESLQSEFDRLWLFNERMNGRELEGMTSFDLTLLHIQIVRALRALIDQRLVPRKEQIAKQRKEFVCHTNKGLISRSAESVHWTMTRMLKLPWNLDFSSFQESSEDSIIVITGRACRRPDLSCRVELLPIDLVLVFIGVNFPALVTGFSVSIST